MNTKQSWSFMMIALLACAPTPAHAQVAVLGSLLREHTAGLGSTYTGSIALQNTTSRPQRAHLYRADYQFKADGTNTFDVPGRAPRSNAAWIRVAPEYITIPPNQVVSVDYTVAVPALPAAPVAGTYWSAIMIEGVDQPAPPGAPTDTTVALHSIVRTAVQIATTIGETGQRQIRFSPVDAAPGAAADSVRSMTIDIENTGELAYRLGLTLELYDADGRSVFKRAGRTGLIYPGCSIRQPFRLGILPPGEYKAILLADPGEGDIFGTQYTLKY